MRSRRVAFPLVVRPAVLCVMVAGLAAEGIAQAVAPGDALRTLTVPEGFNVTRVAGPPLVDRPIMASFDDRGRLYVSDSAGVNLRGAELLKDPPHRIIVLEDS